MSKCSSDVPLKDYHADVSNMTWTLYKKQTLRYVLIFFTEFRLLTKFVFEFCVTWGLHALN